MPDLKLVMPRKRQSDPVPGADSARREHFARLSRPRVRTIALASGKGGVGKSTVAVNVATALGESGARVVLFDADLCQANLDILLGVSPRWDLGHVLRGERTLEQILVPGPRNVRLVPAASGDPDLADLDDFRREGLYRELSRVSHDADVVLIDTASGASARTSSFARAASELLLVTTPEPTSYADAYGLLKVLAGQGLTHPVSVLVNRASIEEAEEVAHRIASISRRFLQLDVQSLGHVPEDPAARIAVQRQEPLVLASPKSPAAVALRALAQRLWAAPEPDPQARAWNATGASRMSA